MREKTCSNHIFGCCSDPPLGNRIKDSHDIRSVSYIAVGTCLKDYRTCGNYAQKLIPEAKNLSTSSYRRTRRQK